MLATMKCWPMHFQTHLQLVWTMDMPLNEAVNLSMNMDVQMIAVNKLMVVGQSKSHDGYLHDIVAICNGWN
jgi:hypothetical protein